jgi:phage-related protein
MPGPEFVIATGAVQIETHHDQGAMNRKARLAGSQAGDESGRSFSRSFGRSLDRRFAGVFRRFFSQAGSFFTKRDGDNFRKGFISTFFTPIEGLKETLIRPFASALSTPIGLGIAAGIATVVGANLGPLLLVALTGGLGAALLAVGIFAQASNKKVKAAWSDTGETIGKVMKRATAPFGPVLVKSLEMIGDAFQRWEKPLTRIFTKLAPVVPKLVGGLIKMAEQALPGLERAMPGVVAFFTTLAKNLPGIGKALGTLFAFLGKPENIAAMRGFLEGLLKLSAWIIGTGIPWLIRLTGVMGDFWDQVKSNWAGLKSFVAWIVDAFPRALKAVERTVQGWATSIRTWFRNTLTAIENRVQGWANGIRSWFSRTLQSIERTVQGWANSIRTWFRNTLTAIEDRVQSWANNLRAWFSRLPGRLLAALGNMRGLLVQKGKDTISGLWDGLKSVWERVKSWILGIPGWIRDHKGPISFDRRLLVPAGRAIMEGLGTGLMFGAKGPFSFIKSLAGTIRGLLDISPSNIFGAIGNLFGGGGGSLASWAAQAVGITGVPVSWIPALIRRAMFESGGNPRAINLWDSNAAAGIPSMGLMQTIGPTFAAHNMPGLDDIWNPVHNMVAAIRYIQARYGTIFAIDPPIRGYRQGGRLPEDVIGFGTRTGRAYQMHRGEDVIRRNQTTVGNQYQGQVVNVGNVTIQVDPRSIQDVQALIQLVSSIKPTVQMHGVPGRPRTA